MTIMDHRPVTGRDRRHWLLVGGSLAFLLIGTWLAIHIGGVFFLDLTRAPVWLAALMVIIQCWLYVGLFIIAHDCMHGSFAPGHPRINRWVGQLCVGLYAAFSLDHLMSRHMAHHRHAGAEGDPDFGTPQPAGYLIWYFRFMSEYLSLRQVMVLLTIVTVYMLVLGANLLNIVVFVALPALLSSLQLFTFGTYLPHRRETSPFADHHNARSNAYPVWLSLITCFHFGYHHEHHLKPAEPWWRLPSVRDSQRRS
jgi:beta-carotene ketolase (CrtW type)